MMSDKEKLIRRSVHSILWLLITSIYFIISFATSAWHITWVIFLIGAALHSAIDIVVVMILDKKEDVFRK